MVGLFFNILRFALLFFVFPFLSLIRKWRGEFLVLQKYHARSLFSSFRVQSANLIYSLNVYRHISQSICRV